MLLGMLETVEGGLCLLEVLEALDASEVPEVMRCVLRCVLENGLVAVFSLHSAAAIRLYNRTHRARKPWQFGFCDAGARGDNRAKACSWLVPHLFSF